MCDPWSLDLELPFVAKLKHKSKRSAWDTAEHLKGQVWGISHCILLNLLLSYSFYLYQLLGRLKWAIFSLFHVFFLCHFHFVHSMPCISDKLHVLVSPGLTQNRWQVLVYYGSITLQMFNSHAGNAVRLEFCCLANIFQEEPREKPIPQIILKLNWAKPLTYFFKCPLVQ